MSDPPGWETGLCAGGRGSVTPVCVSWAVCMAGGRSPLVPAGEASVDVVGVCWAKSSGSRIPMGAKFCRLDSVEFDGPEPVDIAGPVDAASCLPGSGGLLGVLLGGPLSSRCTSLSEILRSEISWAPSSTSEVFFSSVSAMIASMRFCRTSGRRLVPFRSFISDSADRTREIMDSLTALVDVAADFSHTTVDAIFDRISPHDIVVRCVAAEPAEALSPDQIVPASISDCCRCHCSRLVCNCRPISASSSARFCNWSSSASGHPPGSSIESACSLLGRSSPI